MNNFSKILENEKYKNLILTNVYFNKIATILVKDIATNEYIVEVIKTLCEGLVEKDNIVKRHCDEHGIK